MRSLAALFACLLLAALPAAAGADLPAMAEPPTDVIVRYEPGASPAERAEAREDAGVEAEGALPGPQLELVDPEAGVSVAEAVAALEDDPSVLYAEPDVRRAAFVTPNDDLFDSQWALRNAGQLIEGRSGTPGADIAAVDAWNVTTGDPGVVVGVADTGVDLSHPDLVPNLTQGYDFVEDDTTPQDEDGHGSHVSGTVAARGNDATGVSGVAWRAALMPLRVLGADGSGTVSDAIRAYGYAASNGAKVLNLSLGGALPSRAEQDAIAAASGVLFVTAAGNEGLDLDVATSYPCEYELENVVCVGASDRDDRLASFSNRGAAAVDLAAPGTDIASTHLDGQYAILDGTSMATPHVSGAAALLLSVRPDLSATQLRAALLASAEPRPALEGRVATGGRLDLPRALAEVGSPVEPARRDGGGDSGGSSGGGSGGGGSSSGGDSQPAPAPAPATPPIGPQTIAPPIADRSVLVDVRVAARQTLATLTRRGLRAGVTCTEACDARVRLSFASAREARRAGLPRTLAVRTITRTSAGTATVTLRLSAKERSRLRRLRSVRLVVTTVVVDPPGNQRVDVERVTLRRR